MQSLISVIVPIHNVEKQLKYCIESILKQEYDHFELLLIDDGSTDASGAICDYYANIDSRISVFHKKNRGVSNARNYGITKAKGDWFCFIDSDDTIDRFFFTTFEQQLTLNKFDLFMGDVLQEKLNKSSFVEYGLPTGVFSLKQSIIQYDLLRSGDLHGKIFHNSIIKDNGLCFSESINYGEDGLFFCTFLSYSHSIALNSKICYKYTRNKMGLSYKLNSFESEYFTFTERLKVHEQISKCIGETYLKNMFPIGRVIKALLLKNNKQFFINFIYNMNRYEAYYMNIFLHQLRLHKLLVWASNNRRYTLLYYILRLLLIKKI